MDQYSKAYQPTKCTDENGQDRGTFDSPFLAKAREEQEINFDTTAGGWTFAPVTSD